VTDGYDQALANAGLALLAADTSLTVYPGGVPDPTPNPPYVVVYCTVEWPAGAEGDALDGLSGSPTTRWICHCVGGGSGATPAAAEKAARAVAQRVRTQLLNQRPVVAGLDLGMIRQEPGAGVPTRDETTGVPVMDLVVTYRLSATS
jgi:hypothetical protein